MVVASLVAAAAIATFVVVGAAGRRTRCWTCSLFRDRRFSAASLSVTLVFFALMGALFFLTQYLQGVQGLGAFETGIRFIPVALGIMLASAVSAALTVRVGARFAVTLGLLVVAGGLAMMAVVAVDTPDWYLALEMFVVSAGIGLAMTPATDTIMSALPAAQFGVGSAVNDTTREVGGALGIAVLGSLFAGAYAASMADVARAAAAGRGGDRDRLAGGRHRGRRGDRRRERCPAPGGRPAGLHRRDGLDVDHRGGRGAGRGGHRVHLAARPRPGDRGPCRSAASDEPAGAPRVPQRSDGRLTRAAGHSQVPLRNGDVMSMG